MSNRVMLRVFLSLAHIEEYRHRATLARVLKALMVNLCFSYDVPRFQRLVITLRVHIFRDVLPLALVGVIFEPL